MRESAAVPHGRPGARSTAAGHAEGREATCGRGGAGAERCRGAEPRGHRPPTAGGRRSARGPWPAPARGPRPFTTAPARESGRPVGLRRHSSRSPRRPARGLPASRRLRRGEARPGRGAARPPLAPSRALPPSLTRSPDAAADAPSSRELRDRPRRSALGRGRGARADAARPPRACGGGKGRRSGPPLPCAARPLTEPGRSSARRPARLRSSAPRRETAALRRAPEVRAGPGPRLWTAPCGSRAEPRP